ncbi:MAG TPA: muconolactone Delta-isomerase family protein [Terracidiphilus sp.]|nr:muconolactone Delta-isomerase family protein [Terracidiphilus sp.]
MQFLTLTRRRLDAFPAEAFTTELIGREQKRAKELYGSGLARQIWKRGDIAGSVILWEANSEAEVRDALAALPLAQQGMLEVVALIPLEPYPGLAQ